MKTNDLRKAVMDKLKTLTGNVSYHSRPETDMFLHVVFDFDFVDDSDLFRSDYNVVVDLWNKGRSWMEIEDLADSIEALFNDNNSPEDNILPTFYTESKRKVMDEDKSIQHIQIRFVAQTYER